MSTAGGIGPLHEFHKALGDIINETWEISVPEAGVFVETNGKSRWDYTATFQWRVRFCGRDYRVRTHVHYSRPKKAGAPWTKGPGNYWIKGIDGDRPTPPWVVDLCPKGPFKEFGQGKWESLTPGAPDEQVARWPLGEANRWPKLRGR